ncbi:sigma-54 dependent transcriptional regulator [Pseudomonas sp. D(2018)]|uniref:sigma-54 dependent transcriptional regulator n=1 Tax=Pseudomonas sp. D(2018) TaxID=2502238 RepID=UPI0010F46112|nr:sigma-54 dependent transcriptional regulator [Pseudomonas sp. D(2018)]
MRNSLALGARTLLIIDPNGVCDELIPRLEATGWVVRSADLNRAGRYRCDVGLIILTPRDVASPEPIKDLIQRSGSEWIAVLGQELMDGKGISELIGQWFFDFHTLPFDLARLEFALGRALGMSRVRRHGAAVSELCESDFMVGQSPQLVSLRGLLAKLAPTSSPVLIQGESGTGKELVARTLHRLSKRAKGPFIAINCGAISTNLIQSELFGHEKGAFTGAHQRKVGRIEAADGGTLFLDEIGDLPLEMQTNLLRFMQEMTFERVGSHTSIKVDVRVLAATHIDLERAVAEGRFREDLYYRLNVLQVQTTPLRERASDVPLLAEYFSRVYASEVGRRPRSFSDDAIAAMLRYPWKGNVRELANRVRRGQVLAEGRLIEPADLGLAADTGEIKPPMTLDQCLFQAERLAIDAALARCSRHMTKTAQALGVSRPTFYRLLHKHRLLGDDPQSA